MRSQASEGVRNVCVIGAGTMGAGIAAHLANLGFQVALLDVTEEAAEAGLERSKQATPPHFYLPDRANDIRTGSIDQDSALVKEADWVCEAIVERMDAKRSLYSQIEPLLKPDAYISTNTSGLEIGLLAEGRSDDFRSRFMGAHFFNPPRYLKLVELIPAKTTDSHVVNAMKSFLEDRVARRVVLAKDTPGFIANRYGMWCMFAAVHAAERLHLTVEQVDAITGPLLGRPRSATFRLNDIVGLDVMRDIAANLLTRCSEDPYISMLNMPDSTHSLLARGWIGDKVGQGYYRREGREMLAVNLRTFVYNQARPAQFESLESLGKLSLGQRLRQAVELRDEVGEFLREYLLPALRYANHLRDEIAHNVVDFDHVMQWGFGWELGPFAMIDEIGHSKVGVGPKPFFRTGEMLASYGSYSRIETEPEFKPLHEFPVIGGGDTYTLRDLGDGVTAIGLKTKMGVIGPTMVSEIGDYLSRPGHDGIVLVGEGRAFSAGYDLQFFASAIDLEDWDEIDRALLALQGLGELLESKKAVAAVHGYCLGAGLELALSCTHIAAGAESNIGLPESRVGLIPGGRGTTLMRLNNQYSLKRLSEAAMTLTHGTVASNADQARTLGFLRPTDITVYHPDRVLSRAKELVLKSLASARPELKNEPMPLGGLIDRELGVAQASGSLSAYDVSIGHKIKQIFAKSTTYEQSIQRERIEFIDLCQKTLTSTRIKHMLENGKPLRN